NLRMSARVQMGTTTAGGFLKSARLDAEYIILPSIEGGVLEVNVSDSNEQTPLNLEQRSDGFRRILSLYLALANVRRATKATLLLLDEPSDGLHPSVQVHFLHDLMTVCKKNKHIKAIVGTHS